jgi:hypothetical protein
VVSGSEWGNLLVWEGGFIKCEIARKGRKACHLGAVRACYLDDTELITTGLDGYIKVWFCPVLIGRVLTCCAAVLGLGGC